MWSSTGRGGIFSLAKRFTSDRLNQQQQQQPTQQQQQQLQQQHYESRVVKYVRHKHKVDHDDLEDIAVVSGADSGQLTYGGVRESSLANGPKIVPGIITSSRLMEERLSGSATKINTPGSTTALLDSPRCGTLETLLPPAGNGEGGGAGSSGSATVGSSVRSRTFSKHSLLEIVSSRISSTVANSSGLRGKRFSRESFSAVCVNRAAGGDTGDLAASRKKSRDVRRRDLKTKLKLDGWENCGSSSFRNGCNWSFVFDPAGRLCYYWSMVVSLAFLYNFWVLIYRFAFQEINSDTIVLWCCLDYLCDLVYVLDIAFHFRTGYLEEGVLQTDSTKLRQHYMNSTTFYIDSLCLLPLDFLYLSIGFNSMLRCFRLVKIYRFWTFMDRTERHTNYPNVFRTLSLIHYLFVIFHWNACITHIVTHRIGYNQASPYPVAKDDVLIQYLRSYYWCTLMLTTMGNIPEPQTKDHYLLVIIQLIFGLMLFAAVLGHVSNIVINVSAARKEFQAKLDAVKTYMRMRRVPVHLQVKVIKWFDYLWFTQKSSDEEKAVGGLPDKLKAEIAIHVHLDTLKRVEIFQNTEAGFLCELVLRLRPVLFSPGDYICRKGEVGKEMYIVNRGRLQVVADNGKTVLATLKAGSYFGEISILNMGTAGNRRTASVRSVGYSDLFVLSKKDMCDVLKEYPAARVRLEAIAVKRLEKYKKASIQKAAMGRSHSTPGLVESQGRIPLERMELPGTGFYKTDLVTCRRGSTSSSRNHNSSSSSSSSSISSKLSRQISTRRDSCVPIYMTSHQLGDSSHALLPESNCNPSYAVTSSSGAQSSVNYSSRSHQEGLRQSGGAVLHAEHVLVVSSSSPKSPTAGSAVRSCLPPPETLVAEINWLRERLQLLESENAALNTKLSRQQREVENRLTEIEMQICAATSPAESVTDDNERNYESVI